MYSKAKWAVVFITSTFMYGCYSPLVLLSQVDGKILYDTSQVVFLNELLKLFVSLTLLSRTTTGIRGFSLKEALPYAVPGLCYFINNNASFLILYELDPATFSVLSNLKVLSTTLFYILVMKRYPNRLQISALIIMMIASGIHSYDSVYGGGAKSRYNDDGLMQMRATVYGIVLLLCSISLTSFAAVYTEFTLKKDYAVSLYKQNSYLYIIGALLNLLVLCYRGVTHSRTQSDVAWVPLTGFNIYTWIIILNTSLQGFCVSMIMKHSTNITRLVLTCASLIVTASLSIILFDLQINSYFMISTSMVVIALVIYNIGSQANYDPGNILPVKHAS